MIVNHELKSSRTKGDWKRQHGGKQMVWDDMRFKVGYLQGGGRAGAIMSSKENRPITRPLSTS
jgi:hypothetical protein